MCSIGACDLDAGIACKPELDGQTVLDIAAGGYLARGLKLQFGLFQPLDNLPVAEAKPQVGMLLTEKFVVVRREVDDANRPPGRSNRAAS